MAQPSSSPAQQRAQSVCDAVLKGDQYATPEAFIDALVGLQQAAVEPLLKACGEKAACRGCGAAIWWFVTKNGKKLPVSISGCPHFVDCPNADQFRTAKTAEGHS